MTTTSVKDKFQAKKNKAVGSAKETLGKAVGNHKLERDGERQRAKGSLQDTAMKMKDGIKSAIK